MSEIIVSVLCNTYNHGMYIRDALEGFLKQKTNFEFEVLVHDDASTDETPNIIREYAQKYPRLIKPLYQKENQYSKGILISKTYQIPRVKGKYIAICEGDDYWIDPYKLQKQVEALERHPEVDICAHATYSLKGKLITGKMSPSKNDCILSVDNVIKGGGRYVATNSLMYRKEMYDYEIPRFRKIISYDYTFQIWGSLRGGMLYLCDAMSVYRELAVGSWTERMKNNPEKKIKHTERIRNMLNILDEETNHRYHEAVAYKLLHIEFEIFWIKKNYKEIRHDKQIMKILTNEEKLKLYVRSFCKFLDDFRK